MADIEQTPGELNFKISLGDDFSYLLDFDVNLTGYTFAAAVVKKDGTEQAITITETDLAAGKITISLTDAQITALLTDARRWYLTWTVAAASRRILAGGFEIVSYPNLQ